MSLIEKRHYQNYIMNMLKLMKINVHQVIKCPIDLSIVILNGSRIMNF